MVVILIGNGIDKQSQILNNVLCILPRANTLEYASIILPLAMGK